MQNIESTIAKLQASYIAAVAARSVSELAQLYASNVRVFDAWGVWEYSGVGAWQVAINGWLSSDPSNKFQVKFADTVVHGNLELATMTAIVTYASIAPDGSEIHSMQNRITWVVTGLGDTHRILHEHTSAPIGFDDMKAILKK